MAFCTRCGTQNDAGAVFCFKCGEKLKQIQGADNLLSDGQRATVQSTGNQGVNTQNAAAYQYPYNSGYFPEVKKRKKLTPNVPGIVFASLLIIACFLPFIFVGYRGWGEKYTFIETGWGVFVFLGSLAAIVFSILDIKWGIIGPGIGSLVCYVISIISIVSNYNEKGLRLKDIGDLLGELLHMKIGFFAVPILSILLIIFGTSSGGFNDEEEDKDTNSFIQKLRDEGNSSGFWVCCNCGTKNALYIGTCKCGTRKNDERNTVMQPKIVSNSSSARAKCPSCGKEADSSRTTCFYCGARLIK